MTTPGVGAAPQLFDARRSHVGQEGWFRKAGRQGRACRPSLGLAVLWGGFQASPHLANEETETQGTVGSGSLFSWGTHLTSISTCCPAQSWASNPSWHHHGGKSGSSQPLVRCTLQPSPGARVWPLPAAPSMSITAISSSFVSFHWVPKTWKAAPK